MAELLRRRTGVSVCTLKYKKRRLASLNKARTTRPLLAWVLHHARKRIESSFSSLVQSLALHAARVKT